MPDVRPQGLYRFSYPGLRARHAHVLFSRGEMNVPESVYRAAGYRPPFAELPLNDPPVTAPSQSKQDHAHRPKGEKRPANVIGDAIKIARIATGEEDGTTLFPDDDGKDKAVQEMSRRAERRALRQ